MEARPRLMWYMESSPSFNMVLLPCLLVNHDFSSRRHLAYECLGWSLIFPVHAKRHVRPPVVVPFHEQVHGITLAHHYRLKLRQLALDLPVQPLQLAVCLRVPDACKDLPDSKLDEPFFKGGCPLFLCLRGAGVELGGGELLFVQDSTATIDIIYLTMKEKVDQLWLLITRELLRTFIY